MQKENKEPIFTPEVLVIHHYLLSFGLKIPRATVRKKVESIPGFPRVSIKDTTQILEDFNLETLAFKAKISALNNLELPVIVFLRNEAEGYFVILKKISHGLVYYYSPILGDEFETTESFEKKWNGVVVAASIKETDPLLETNYPDEEAIQGNIYRQNNIREIPGFLSQEECSFIINYCEEKNLFKRSELIYDDGKVDTGLYRTSYSGYLNDRTVETFTNIYQKVANFLQVPEDHIENLQCVRYGEGQEFKPHFDSVKVTNRVHTVLIYLNDDYESGETYFPELDLKVKPKQGKALYFLDRDEHGINILHSVHAGLPIKNGVKYCCNIWVKDRPINADKKETKEFIQANA